MERTVANKVLAIIVSSDRGLAGSYDVNIIREILTFEEQLEKPVEYITIGKKGREMLRRRGKQILAEFSDIPIAPSFGDLSSIGYLAVEHYLSRKFDQVYLIYTKFISKAEQKIEIEKILPLTIPYRENIGSTIGTGSNNAVFIYEPDETALLDSIIPKFISLQIYQANPFRLSQRTNRSNDRDDECH